MMVVDPPDRATFPGNNGVSLQHRRRHRGFHRIKPECVGLTIVQRDACPLPWCDLLNQLSDDPPKALRIALGIQRISHVEKGPIAQIGVSHEAALSCHHHFNTPKLWDRDYSTLHIGLPLLQRHGTPGGVHNVCEPLYMLQLTACYSTHRGSCGSYPACFERREGKPTRLLPYLQHLHPVNRDKMKWP